MCQGFTSAGGNLSEANNGEFVVINAEGKEHAMAIGMLVKSSEQIKSENSGIAVENLNCLNDDLWKLKDFKRSTAK